nr:unnamed protein product [Callosobruchus analis]
MFSINGYKVASIFARKKSQKGGSIILTKCSLKTEAIEKVNSLSVEKQCEIACPILQELFLKWCNLSDKEKVLLNYLAYYVLDKSHSELYASIVQGLTYWNAVQDFEGK